MHLLSFSQLTGKYCIPKQDFFRYLQVRDYVRKDTILFASQSISRIERQLFLQQSSASTSTFYSLLKKHNTIGSLSVRETWEKELNIEITDIDWSNAWKCA